MGEATNMPSALQSRKEVTLRKWTRISGGAFDGAARTSRTRPRRRRMPGEEQVSAVRSGSSVV
jgi:hypothetical protein